MGPPGLWVELRRRGGGVVYQGLDAERLVEGKRVAVDCSIWLYEAQLQPALLAAFGPHRAALKVVFERCTRWIRKGVLPVVVLEGAGGGRKARTAKGGLSSAKLNQTLAGPAREVRQLLTSLGVPFVNAEGEAEATCADLASSGICDFVASSDSDALLFGAPIVLHGLDLQVDAAASRVEVWDAAELEKKCGLNRTALTAAAAMIGCDYSGGVKNVGCRGALDAICKMQTESTQDVLQVLDQIMHAPEVTAMPAAKDFNCVGCRRCGHGCGRKAVHGPRGCKECGTSEGCNPRLAEGSSCECKGCKAAAAAGGRSEASNARACARIMQRVACGSDGKESLRDVSLQYLRKPDSFIATLAAAPALTWSGVQEERVALETLAKIFSPEVCAAKLLPLQMEWVLRRLAEETADFDRLNVDAMTSWAVKNGFRWIPTLARRYLPKAPEAAAAGSASLSIVRFEAIQDGGDDMLLIECGPQKFRTALADACGILPVQGSEPAALKSAFALISAECPQDTRESYESLCTWVVEKRLPYVPRSAAPIIPSRPRGQWNVRWAGALDRSIADVELTVAWKLVGNFGGFLSTCSGKPLKQRNMLDFLVKTSTNSPQPAVSEHSDDTHATVQVDETVDETDYQNESVPVPNLPPFPMDVAEIQVAQTEEENDVSHSNAHPDVHPNSLKGKASTSRRAPVPRLILSVPPPEPLQPIDFSSLGLVPDSTVAHDSTVDTTSPTLDFLRTPPRQHPPRRDRSGSPAPARRHPGRLTLERQRESIVSSSPSSSPKNNVVSLQCHIGASQTPPRRLQRNSTNQDSSAPMESGEPDAGITRQNDLDSSSATDPRYCDDRFSTPPRQKRRFEHEQSDSSRKLESLSCEGQPLTPWHAQQPVAESWDSSAGGSGDVNRVNAPSAFNDPFSTPRRKKRTTDPLDTVKTGSENDREEPNSKCRDVVPSAGQLPTQRRQKRAVHCLPADRTCPADLAEDNHEESSYRCNVDNPSFGDEPSVRLQAQRPPKEKSCSPAVIVSDDAGLGALGRRQRKPDTLQGDDLFSTPRAAPVWRVRSMSPTPLVMPLARRRASGALSMGGFLVQKPTENDAGPVDANRTVDARARAPASSKSDLGKRGSLGGFCIDADCGTSEHSPKFNVVADGPGVHGGFLIDRADKTNLQEETLKCSPLISLCDNANVFDLTQDEPPNAGFDDSDTDLDEPSPPSSPSSSTDIDWNGRLANSPCRPGRTRPLSPDFDWNDRPANSPCQPERARAVSSDFDLGFLPRPRVDPSSAANACKQVSHDQGCNSLLRQALPSLLMKKIDFAPSGVCLQQTVQPPVKNISLTRSQPNADRRKGKFKAATPCKEDHPEAPAAKRSCGRRWAAWVFT